MGTGKSKLEIGEYDRTSDTPENVTVIIFVRHGTSCANLRRDNEKLDYFRISDPGLTRKGIYDAREQGKKLRGKLESNYGKIEPTVCASVLLRAQMTAYLMMNPNLGVKYTITILPYISEIGNVFQEDNKPQSFDQQAEALTKLKPDFVNMTRNGYIGYKDDGDSNKLKPNLDLFTDELGKVCKKNAEEKQTDTMHVPTTRCSVKNKMVNISERDTRTNYAPIIIVTHGKTLQKFLEKMGSEINKSERPNFVAYRVYFNHITGKFIKNPIDSNDAINNPENPKRLSYFYRYDDKLSVGVDVKTECIWESKYPACESEVCNTSKSLLLTGGRTRKRMRRKSRKRTQKNS